MCGAEDADGDLAAVGDEDSLEFSDGHTLTRAGTYTGAPPGSTASWPGRVRAVLTSFRPQNPIVPVPVSRSPSRARPPRPKTAYKPTLHAAADRTRARLPGGGQAGRWNRAVRAGGRGARRAGGGHRGLDGRLHRAAAASGARRTSPRSTSGRGSCTAGCAAIAGWTATSGPTGRRWRCDRLPGPFDFFTIDVSFVAARSMLRSLAFRLRRGGAGGGAGQAAVRAAAAAPRGAGAPGGAVPRAGGVPQEGRGAGVRRWPGRSTRRWRAAAARSRCWCTCGSPAAPRACRRARRRGRAEGGKAPRTATGGAAAKKASGSLRGSARGRRSRRARSCAGSRWWRRGWRRWRGRRWSGCPGCAAVEVVPGGVAFAGPLAVGAAANLWLRVATRVLLRRGDGEGARVLQAAPAARQARLRPVRAPRSSRCGSAVERHALAPLPHEGDRRDGGAGHRRPAGQQDALAAPAAAEEGRTPLAPARSARRSGGRRAAGEDAAPTDLRRRPRRPPDGAPECRDGEPPRRRRRRRALETRVLVRGEDDVWTVSVDASGELLHRRGWRLEAGRAPLRETLAAGVLALAAYDPARPLIDAMCGAGTLASKARRIAAGRAPGLGRSFALERWPGWQARRWEQDRVGDRNGVPGSRAARCRRRPSSAGTATRRCSSGPAQRRARRPRRRGRLRAAAGAGLARAGGLAPGLVVINPPYGRRLANPAAARALRAARWAGAARPLPRVARGLLLAPDARWARPLLGLEGPAVHPLR